MTPLARRLQSIANRSKPWGAQRQSRRAQALHHAGFGDSAADKGDTTAQVTSLALKPLARVEAVLFLASDAVSLRRIAQLANLEDATEARTLVSQLQKRNIQQGHAFQVENIAGGYRLLTKPQFAPWIGKLGDLSGLEYSQLKLTPPALDTLTVVAYRQPVLRSEVEAIRGVGCGELLRQLIERDLLRIVGRSEELGKPLMYGTTKRFLQVFGLRSLGDLPPVPGLTHSADTSSQKLSAQPAA